MYVKISKRMFVGIVVVLGGLCGCGAGAGGGGAGSGGDTPANTPTVTPPDTAGGQLYELVVTSDPTAASAKSGTRSRATGWGLAWQQLGQIGNARNGRAVSNDPFDENPENLDGEAIADIVEEVLQLPSEANPWRNLGRGNKYFYWEPSLGDVYVGGYRTAAGAGGWVIVFEDELDGVPDDLRFTLVDESGNPVAELVYGSGNGDSDGDGVPNDQDRCPATGAGEVANPAGCSVEDYAEEWDDANNSNDNASDVTTNGEGEEEQQPETWRDADVDGVQDADDRCPNTPGGAQVDAAGCGCSQLDADSDGVDNCDDECAGTSAGAAVDAFGCSVNLDPDGDGFVGDADACPDQGGLYLQDGCPIAAPRVTFGDPLVIDNSGRPYTIEWYVDNVRQAGGTATPPALADNWALVQAEMDEDYETAFVANRNGFVGVNFLQRCQQQGLDSGSVVLKAVVKDQQYPALATTVTGTETVDTLIVRGTNGGSVVTAPNGGERRLDLMSTRAPWNTVGVWLFIPNAYMAAGETGGVRIVLEVIGGSGDYTFTWTWKESWGVYYFWEITGVGSGTVTSIQSQTTRFSRFVSPWSDGHAFIGWSNNQTGGYCHATVNVLDNVSGDSRDYDVVINVE